MKGNNFRIILVFLVLVCVMITFASCSNKESLPDTSESSTEKEEATNVDISSETGVSLSLDKRKDLAGYYYVKEFTDTLMGAPKFSEVDWDNTRYKDSVKQVDDTKYEVDATIFLFDKYENLVCTMDIEGGTVFMEEDGTFDHLYRGNVDFDWE